MSESQRLILLWASGILGLLIGSFLNVCIFRLPRNCMSIVKPRSRCPKCLSLIAWYDNFPVLSWLLLGRKCRSCRAPISARYAAVEALTGVLFLIAALRLLPPGGHPDWQTGVLFAVHAAFLSALIVCTFIDYDFQILPNEITVWGLALAVAASAAFPFVHAGTLVLDYSSGGMLTRAVGGSLAYHVSGLVSSVFGAFIGGGTIYVVGVLGQLIFRKEAMGFGDVKYVAMFGALLGWRDVLLSFVLACLLGSVFGLGRFVVVRRMGYVPFGPFLSAGALGMLFWSPAVLRGIELYMNGVHRLGDVLFGR
jgi:leader peptidase (prepilin peptidase)/N-methyltransferase